MEVRVINARDLAEPLAAEWRCLQASNPDLVSPCLSPEFVQHLGAIRDDIRVAVIAHGSETAAFFPFQLHPRGIGKPMIMCDYQAIIARPDFSFDPRELIRKAGLVAWDFDHLLASTSSFAPFHKTLSASPVIDVRRGFDAYVQERRNSGTEQIKKAANLRRRIERDVGPLRFEPHVPDEELLRQVIAWADAKYHRSSAPDTWQMKFFRRILKTQQEHFRGTLSLLYAGDTLVAGHFGMRSKTVWHYWFPGYNSAFARYSVGVILLLEIARHAAETGLHAVDLGKGDQSYKTRLANGSVALAEGCVERLSWITAMRRARRAAAKVVWLKQIKRRLACNTRRLSNNTLADGTLQPAATITNR